PTRTMPYTPMFTIAALISADTWLGASGWARGSHTCRGTMPALEANPAKVARNTALRTAGDRPSAASRITANDSPWDAAANPASPAKTATKPRWVMTAYHSPASRTDARLRCSATTSTRDVIAMSSQASRNVLTLAAAGTSSIVTTNSGGTACTARPSSASPAGSSRPGRV